MDIEICSVKFLDMAISYKKTYKQFANLLNLIENKIKKHAKPIH